MPTRHTSNTCGLRAFCKAENLSNLACWVCPPLTATSPQLPSCCACRISTALGLPGSSHYLGVRVGDRGNNPLRHQAYSQAQENRHVAGTTSDSFLRLTVPFRISCSQRQSHDLSSVGHDTRRSPLCPFYTHSHTAQNEVRPPGFVGGGPNQLQSESTLPWTHVVHGECSAAYHTHRMKAHASHTLLQGREQRSPTISSCAGSLSKIFIGGGSGVWDSSSGSSSPQPFLLF